MNIDTNHSGFFSGHPIPASSEKEWAYAGAEESLLSVLEVKVPVISKMATINSVLRSALPFYFWNGFYLVQGEELIVGPYQGTLGCLKIAWGKGVCGTAVSQKKTQIVPDVHAFPGHIACDSRSLSEIVVPVLNGKGELLGVYDVDSVQLSAFDQVDAAHLERILAHHFRDVAAGPSWWL